MLLFLLGDVYLKYMILIFPPFNQWCEFGGSGVLGHIQESFFVEGWRLQYSLGVGRVLNSFKFGGLWWLARGWILPEI